ncbi:MAG: hypothetical protein QOJ55_1150 [Solirubrobacteraceae bacterium]|nr:hypothetical protein [Solirubrobacteraceae bacterium]
MSGITSAAKLEATTEHGLELDEFKFTAAAAPLGPVVLKNMNFEWLGPEKRLTAGLEATILYKVGAGGTIVFEHGDFRSLKVFAESFPGVVLAPGINLTRVDAAYDDRGPVIEGAGTLTLGPNPGGGCPKVGVVGHAKLDFNYPTTLSVGGDTKLLCFNVASIGASMNEYGYGTFFGRFNPDLSPLPVTLDAIVQGQVQVPIERRPFAFQMDMNVTGCVNLGRYAGVKLKGCVKGEFTASDRALGFCADFDWVSAGIRMFYPPPASLLNPVSFAAAVIANSKILAPTCDLGPYRTLPKLASAAAAGSSAFTMPAGGKDSLVAFHGTGGAPDLILRGPGGRTIDVPTTDMVHNGSYVAFRLDYDDTTYVIIRRAEAGRWTVEQKPGSPDVASIQMAAELPPVKIQASVKKVGSGRELRYRVNTRKGQRIRFTEFAGPKAGQFLGTTAKASGRIRFTPADSSTRSRKILAYVEQDGAPRKTLTVARFQASNLAIGRPLKLRATRRKGSKLFITWRAAANAQSYRATVQLSDGRTLFFTPSRSRRTLVIQHVGQKTTGTVTVRGERMGPRFGRQVRIQVRAVKTKKR